MASFTVLLDAPAEAKQRLQIATLGDFNDARYGDFSITRDDVEQWRRNLEYLPGKRALIDLDHRSDRSPRNTEAAGWITDVGWDDDGTPVADVEWTTVGERALAEKRYLFFSPTYGPHKTEDGTVHENTLVGGALTNRPFLTGMPAITLASSETLSLAVDQIERDNALRLLDALHASQPDAAAQRADSRRSMSQTLLKTLGLPDDADEQTMLDAITELKAKAEQAPEPPASTEPVKTLDQLAADEGKIVLDADTVRTLHANAAAGAAAMTQLHEQRFQTAFELALNDPKGPRVKPAEKEQLQHFYTLDADATISMIESREPVVAARPAGAPAIEFSQLDADADPQQLVAAGIHPQGHQLHERIRKHMLDNKLPESQYGKVLEQHMNGAVVL